MPTDTPSLGPPASDRAGPDAIFHSDHPELPLLRELAEENRERIHALDPLIEALTGTTCPTCKAVCCISRHGRMAPDDRVYYRALNLEVPESSSAGPETSPCGFLGPTGCRLPRMHRPYRCTWYFCTALIEAIEEMPARGARALHAELAGLSSARTRMMEVYAAIRAAKASGPLSPNRAP